MAKDEHEKILKQGVEVWNQWRKENPTIRPDLVRAKLVRADLRNANLSRAHLVKADLCGTKLQGSDLHSANLIRADLRGAQLNVGNCSIAMDAGFESNSAELEKLLRARKSIEDQELARVDDDRIWNQVRTFEDASVNRWRYAICVFK